MGIPRLWKLLEPAANTALTMHDLTLRDGFEANPHWGVYRLGVDASIWIEQCSQAYNAGHRVRKSPELVNLFKRLANLLAVPVQAVFVFDGTKRPPIKRGKAVIYHDIWMVDDFKAFANAFGFAFHTAPGEAEAELARMNELGIIDGVLTDDSDIFIFGARTVIRNTSYTDNSDKLEVYKKEDVQKHEDIGLNRAGLVLVALLCGGDYDRSGLRGCGITIAKGVAQYGLGDTLWDAALHMPDELLKDVFLPTWRDNLRACLKTDPLGHIGACHPALARAVTDVFPSLDVVHYYVHPVTTRFAPFYHIPLPQFPHIGLITELCELEDLFGGFEAICARFRELLWPGIALRELLEQVFTHANCQRPLPTSGLLHLEIMAFGGTFSPAKLKASSGSIEAVIRAAMLGVRRKKSTQQYVNPQKAARWRAVHVPSTILCNARVHLGLTKACASRHEAAREGSTGHRVIDLTDEA